MSIQESLVHRLLIKYKPYWPIFIILSFIVLGMAYIYVYRSLPKYQATASLIIKDEKKGNDDSRIMESLNLIGSKKIIENEIEVLKSRPVIEAVIKKLHLYANFYVKHKYKDEFLYNSGDLLVEAFDPYQIKSSNRFVPLTLIETKGELYLRLGDKMYKPGNWVNTPYGKLRFNHKQVSRRLKVNQPYSIEFVNIQTQTNRIYASLKVISSNKLSSIIEIKYRDLHYQLAEKVLNELIASYNRAAITEKNSMAKNTLRFIEERLNVVGSQLNDIEKKIQTFKSNSGAIDISTQGQLYLQNVSSNDQKLSEVNLQLSVINSLENDISAQVGSSGAHTVLLTNSDPVFAQILTSLNTAELEREKLKKTVAENNPMLIAVNDQIAKIRQHIGNTIIDRRRSLEAAKKNLQQTNSNYTSLLHSIPSKERELLEISRDQQIKSGIYSFLLQKREESELSYVSNLSDSRVVNFAHANPIPVEPNTLAIFGIAFMAIWLVPVGFISIKETFAPSILYRDEIEQLTDLPVIGELALHKFSTPIAIERGKRSLVAEEFRRIRYALQYYVSHKKSKKYLITSSLSGEGKSFISSNLAISFSLSGKKVALVDFDLHHSSLEKLFIHENKPGIADYVTGDVAINSILYPVKEYNSLYFIPGGSRQSDPSLCLELDKVQDLMNYLEAEFDIVIIDSPPVALVSDAYTLSNYCSATIYVIRHGYTPKQLIKRLDATNEINPLVNPLLVFNGVKNRGIIPGNNGYGYGVNSAYGGYYNS